MLRWRLFDGLTLLTVLLLSSAVVAQSTLIEGLRPGVTQRLAEHRKTVLSRLSYDLSFDLPADLISAFRRRLSLSLNFQKPTSRWCWILKNRQKNSAPSKSTVNRRIIGLNLASCHSGSRATPGQNRISVQFTAGDSSLNRNLEFLYRFCPGPGATAFPLFDQPNLKARYTLTLTMPADWEAIANAPLQQLEALGRAPCALPPRS